MKLEAIIKLMNNLLMYCTKGLIMQKPIGRLSSAHPHDHESLRIQFLVSCF